MRREDWLRSLTEKLRGPSEPPAGGPESAGVAAIITEEGELLTVRRAERHGDPWSGQWALPGGRWSAQDSDMLSTVRREVREETGIDIDKLGPLGWLPERRSRIRPEFRVFTLVLLSGVKPGLRLNDELVDATWVRLDALRSERRVMETQMGPREMEAYVSGDVLIWGLTHSILSDILALSGIGLLRE